MTCYSKWLHITRGHGAFCDYFLELGAVPVDRGVVLQIAVRRGVRHVGAARFRRLLGGPDDVVDAAGVVPVVLVV